MVDITGMTDEEFLKEFLVGLLRNNPMAEKDILQAANKAREYQIGATMISMLMEGKIDTTWDGENFRWSLVEGQGRETSNEGHKKDR